jgi:hypothetical protein
MKCPGQDPRYWTGEVVIEVPCPECGVAVEIFRDEHTGRCLRCGHRFSNPGADLGCAKWCAMANECLGLSPQRRSQPGAGVAEGALAARLIQWIEQRFKDDPPRIARALKAFQRVKELIRKEGGDPRVAFCAALLLAVDADQPADAAQPAPETDAPCGPMSAEQILRHVGVEAEVAAHVFRIMRACRQGEIIDAVEFRVVREALAESGADRDA